MATWNPGDYSARITESVSAILGASQIPDGTFDEIVSIICQEFPDGGDPSVIRPRIDALVALGATGSLSVAGISSGVAIPGTSNVAPGSLFFKIDSGVMYVFNGTAWVVLSSGSGGGPEAACNVDALGTIASGIGGLAPGFVLGCTVVKLGGDGLYEITLTTPRGADECVMFVGTDNVGVVAVIAPVSAAVKQISVADFTGTAQDAAFNFAIFTV